MMDEFIYFTDPQAMRDVRLYTGIQVSCTHTYLHLYILICIPFTWNRARAL